MCFSIIFVAFLKFCQIISIGRRLCQRHHITAIGTPASPWTRISLNRKISVALNMTRAICTQFIWTLTFLIRNQTSKQYFRSCISFFLLVANRRMSKHLAKVRVEKQSYAQDLYETESGVYGISRNPSGVSTKSSFVSIAESSPRTIVSSKKTTPRQQVIVVPERPRLPIRSFRDIPMPQTSGG